MEGTLAPGEIASLRRHRPFALFWSARVMSSLAYQMQAVAVGWQLYHMTHSAAALSLIGLVQFLPILLLTLVAGHVADRYDRRRVAAICQRVEAAAAAALAFGSLLGWLTPLGLFAFVAVIGAMRAFEMPTMQTLVPRLVPPGMLARAVAGSATANQTAVICGPALGGIIYALSPAATYAVCGLAFLGGSLAVSLIEVATTRSQQEPPTLASLFAGIAFIRVERALLGAISLDLFAVLLGGATALLPIYAHDILLTGSWGLGLLRSAPALGAIAVSLALTRASLSRHVGHIMFGAVAAFGIATIIFGLSRWLPLSLAALAVLGAADALSVVIRQTLVQIETPDVMRGRVSAVNAVFIGSSNTLGDFESAILAAWVGAVSSAVIGGVGTLVVALIWARAFPELWRLESLSRRAAPRS